MFVRFILKCIMFVQLMQSRFDILKIHSRRMNLMRGIDLKKIAEKMNGASGAELKVCVLSSVGIFLAIIFYIKDSAPLTLLALKYPSNFFICASCLLVPCGLNIGNAGGFCLFTDLRIKT